jgi:hypothetical protein
VALLVARFTWADCTPGTLPIIFSTRLTQEAHVMPSTSKVRREPLFEALLVIEITLQWIVNEATLGLDPMGRSTADKKNASEEAFQGGTTTN